MNLRDVLTESYDIYVKEQEYFCVPKYGAIVDETTYELRNVSELDIKIDRNTENTTFNDWSITSMTTPVGFISST